MSLIKCPKCGKEVSDKASKCVQCGYEFGQQKIRFCSECGKEIPVGATECLNCGCPIEKNIKQDLTSNSNNQTIVKNKKNIVKIIIPVVIFIIIGIVFYNIKVVKPKNIYNEAISLLEKGKYDEANNLLNTINSYSDVETLQEQLKYESYAYSAINDLKKYLKNPESYQPYEITFYASMSSDEEEIENTEESHASENEDVTNYPVCIMHYGAQNGFGGNTTGYALCSYDSETKEYNLLGTCNSLDEDDYDIDDEDDRYDLFICNIINLYRDGGDIVGDIDLARLKTVLKNDAYSTIKIIE